MIFDYMFNSFISFVYFNQFFYKLYLFQKLSIIPATTPSGGLALGVGCSGNPEALRGVDFCRLRPGRGWGWGRGWGRG